ncbi:MAG: GTPase ObgE [Armatimonadetes bacterium]|nr:MAG: GTPase ObgE [Armatimonadota bacterium]
MFVDEIQIVVTAGRGGDGAATFRREKHVPRGGPDGGDGGRGGDVVLVADAGMNTLLDYRFKSRYRAEDGGPGGSAKKHGKDGDSVELRVPVGTIVRDAETGEVLADLVEDGQRVVVARGGQGGRGNLHFTTSVRQAPTFAEKGEPGENRTIRLELRLLADVGLVGKPNAGKSTLLSAVSAARPEIADYPFTTLVPYLGLVRVGEESFVMADLPGLIEGAAEGKGLGIRFLKHISRTRLLLHVVEAQPLDGSKPEENLRAIQRELEAYSKELADRPRIIVLSKCDLLPEEEAQAKAADLAEEFGAECFAISAVTGAGVQPLLRRIALVLKEIPRPKPIVEETIGEQPAEAEKERFQVLVEEGVYRVRGREIEDLIRRFDLENDEAVSILQRRLERVGLFDALKSAGAQEGDTVVVGPFEFEYREDE